MPIQLIDNFELNVQKPIDNRFVVGGTSSFYPTRFDIVNAYNGLRIWDLNDTQGYVYNGVTWTSEASLTTIQGSGITDYLAKFSTSNSLNVSSIYENSGVIIIGTNSLPSTNISKLIVEGSIKVNSGHYYYGSGQFLTSLDATQINLGTLDLARLQVTGASGYILSRNASTATWISPTQFEVGTASALSTSRTLWGQSFNGTANVTGNISVLGSVTNVDALRFRNSNGGSLNMLWTNPTNLPFTLSIPASANRTMALLEQTQTFTSQNTFSNFTLFNSSIQVAGTSSFGNEMKVRVTRSFPPFGPITTEPLNVMFGGIAIGVTSSNSSPLVTINGSYTWYGDDDTAMQRLSPSLGSTQGCILFKANNRTQMVLGQGVTPGYVHNSTAGETYSTAAIALLSTPGVSMMSIISNWVINYNASSVGNEERFLNTIQGPVFFQTLSTPIITFGGYKYDALLSLSCGRNAIVICFLEVDLGSGIFSQVANIGFGGAYNFIIPAGRKWRVSLRSNLTPTFNLNTQLTEPQTIFTLYKYGMN